MTPERRAFIERRRRAITPGHWNCVGLHPHSNAESLLTVRPDGGGVWFTNEDDAYFVAAAPEFVDELLTEIDRLTGERDAFRSLWQRLKDADDELDATIGIIHELLDEIERKDTALRRIVEMANREAASLDAASPHPLDGIRGVAPLAWSGIHGPD